MTELLKKYAKKMNLKEDNALFDKAEEIRRLCEAKSVTGAPNAGSLMVVYLDLAAQILGFHGDQRNAKMISSLAGFKNPAPYAALLNNVKSQLKLESMSGELTVEEVCVRLGVPNARIPSLKLLKSYISLQTKKYPLSKMKMTPAHSCAAVAVICKSSKISYDKTTLFNLSESPSRVALNKLIFDMTLDKKTSVSDTTKGKKDGAALGLVEEEEMTKNSRETTRMRDRLFLHPDDEEKSYQRWKADILKKANLIDPCK